MISRESRIRGGMWGLLVGDAIGVPYEFRDPRRIPPPEEIGIKFAGDFFRTHGQPDGTWSDDGACALAMAQACLDSGHAMRQNIPASLAGHLVSWKEHGAFTPDRRVFDIGNATARAIERLSRGVRWQESADRDPQSNGNGSLMRALPLALWHAGSNHALGWDAVLASSVTHAHNISTAACALYSFLVRAFMNEADEARSIRFAWSLLESEFGLNVDTPLREEIRKYETPSGSGYVVDSLAFALKIAGEASNRNFASVIRDAVRLGHDTDTTASIAGGLAGVIYGYEAIPEEWLDGMRGKEIATPIIEALVREAADVGDIRERTMI